MRFEHWTSPAIDSLLGPREPLASEIPPVSTFCCFIEGNSRTEAQNKFRDHLYERKLEKISRLRYWEGFCKGAIWSYVICNVIWVLLLLYEHLKG